MATGPKKGQKQAKPRVNRRGGARKGAGRPRLLDKFFASEHQIRKMLLMDRKLAIQEGITLDEILLNLAYHSEDEKIQLSAIKLFKDYTITKRIHTTQGTPTAERSKMGLPTRKPDPAKLNVFKGGRSDLSKKDP